MFGIEFAFFVFHLFPDENPFIKKEKIENTTSMAPEEEHHEEEKQFEFRRGKNVTPGQIKEDASQSSEATETEMNDSMRLNRLLQM